MTQRFRDDNTEGYTSEELVELNELFWSEGELDEFEDGDEWKARGERIANAFDTRLAQLRAEVTSLSTVAAWVPALKRGAPSNAAAPPSGLYPTRKAALAHEHWANQAAWASARKIWLYDDEKRHVLTSDNERRFWDNCGGIGLAAEYVPGYRRVIELADAGLFAQATIELFRVETEVAS